ncbi:MAG TPA: hypothetical protein V6C58_26725 [Allocoleopsis sp.]
MNKFLKLELTHDFTSEKKEVEFELKDNFVVNSSAGGANWRLPQEIYPYLNPEDKKAWDCGWRGKLVYFCTISYADLKQIYKKSKDDEHFLELLKNPPKNIKNKCD